MAKRVLSTIYWLSLIFAPCLCTAAWAEYSPFTEGQTGQELVQTANQNGFAIEFRSFPARNAADFDRAINIKVRGRQVYADWVNTYRIGRYGGQKLSIIKKQFENSPIKLEIEYIVTKNIDQYGLIIRQNLQPGRVVAAQCPPYSKVLSQSNLFKRPTLNNPRLSSYTGRGNYSPPNFYHNNNGDVVLKLTVLTMEPVEMIDLAGLTFQEAKTRLSNMGMPIGYIQDTYEKTYQANLYGKIFKQSIPAGTLLTEPKMMGVMIYAFPETKMPDLTKGWTIDRAEQEPYLIIVPNYIPTDDIAKDRLIIAQDIKADSPLVKKTSVRVNVYRYRNPFNRLDYINVHRDVAIKLLNEKNLRYRIETKDIFDHFKSTFDLEFIKQNDMKVVEAEQQGTTVVLTVLQYTPQSDAMPDLVGKDCQAAIQDAIILQKALPGLTYSTEYIPTELLKSDGLVVRIEPEAFTPIKSYDTIKIFCGKATITNIDDIKAMVPDLRGQTADEAKQELSALGFSKIVVTKEKKVGAVDGTVVDLINQIGMSAIGYKTFKSEKITINIADIQAIEMPEMGHYAGLSPDQAKMFLLHLGYRNFEFESEADSYVKYVSDQPPGKVIATVPRWKTKLPYGKDTLITLIVRPEPGQALPEAIHLNPPDKPETVKVPGLKLTLAETIQVMEDNDLVPVVTYEVTKFAHFKDKIKPGSVPAWQTIVKRGSKVAFTVYTLKAVVPPVTIFDENTAISLIENNNLKATVSYVPTNIKSQDKKVSTQDPSGGVLMEPGAIVKLKVFQFSGLSSMPNILFRKYGQSVATLLNDYFSLQHKVVEIPTEFEEDDGKIIKTLPPADAKIKEGSVVELHVYKLSTNAKRIVPNVSYLPLEVAIQELEHKTFKIQQTIVATDSVTLEGRVATQSPAAGSRLAPGSTITLSVYNHSGVSLVPDFYNQPTDPWVMKAIENKGLKYEIIEAKKDGWETVPLGHIYRTEPAANEKINRGGTIKLYIYKIAGKVPSLIGLKEQQAESLLTAAGYVVLKEYQVGDSPETVHKQLPAPFTLPKHVEVTLTIEKKGVRVPSIVSSDLESAEKVLKAKEFQIKTVYVRQSSALAGTVVEQKPLQGSNVVPGTVITLSVAEYPNGVEVPNLIGQRPLKEVIDLLEKKKLKHEIIPGKDVGVRTSNWGRIYEIQPAPGSKVKAGTTLKLYSYTTQKRVPDVIGKPEVEATKVFEDFGFAVSKYYVVDAAAPGTVISQSQKSGNPPLHAAITLAISKGAIVPNKSMNVKLSQPGPEIISAFTALYNNFKAAYESKDEYAVSALISGDWGSSDGNSISDLEDNLHNMFSVFDDIEYSLSGLSISEIGTNLYNVGYSVTIRGTIFDNDLTHEEVSAVTEQIIIDSSGQAKIHKTLGGNYWSRQ
ncbi:MAG: PASTA domain-containing protein [Desulfuromonadaceae bacterium]|nr:PASTA domain-containing protein [Desulfuromonadaceae bacterium]